MSYSDVRQKVFRVPDNIVLSVGLSWDFIGPDPVDLDLSAVCFTKEGRFIDLVFFGHLFPESTDIAALRSAYLVDEGVLPYMFLSGDSTIGGEEENQMPGLTLAARRRYRQFSSGTRGASQSRDAASTAANIWNRLYEEEDLQHVQAAVDDAAVEVYEDEDGVQRSRGGHRELSDEVLTFVMGKLPAEADVVFLSVSSYSGHDFSTLSRVELLIHNESTNERVGSIDLKSSTANGTANLACMFVRVPADGAGAAEDGVEDTVRLYDQDVKYWDLRELNVRSFGYTFVDVLPIAMEILGVPQKSWMSVLRNIPDYSLSKEKTNLTAQSLSDVRFGVGWSGEHDLDAFLVMLDDSYNYVDHLYPKNGKLRSAIRDLARHSGDAVSGSAAAGDEEFIDLLTYRVPANVGCIVVGAAWVESFGAQKDRCKSIYDIPDLYLRLQNRTVLNPYSTELDRWNIACDAAKEAAAAAAASKHDGKSSRHRTLFPTTYVDPGTKATQPVRMVVLGMLVKTGMQPFEALFPGGRRIDQHFHRSPPVRDGGDAGLDSPTLSRIEALSELGAGVQPLVPLFQFIPIHQYVPIDPRGQILRSIPSLQCLAAYTMAAERDSIAAARRRAVSEVSAEQGVGGVGTSTGGRTSVSASRPVLSRENNMVGWAPATGQTLRRGSTAVQDGPSAVAGTRSAVAAAAAQEQEEAEADAAAEAAALRAKYDRMWIEMKQMDRCTDLYAIEVQFLEVVALHPLLPDRFKCHGEVWIFGRTSCLPVAKEAISIYDNTPFKSPFLVSRDHLVWDGDDAESTSSSGYFIVHQYDRLRVALFEHASVGMADIDLMSMDALWSGENRENGRITERYNVVECNVVLESGAAAPSSSSPAPAVAYQGEVRLRICRVPLHAAEKKLQRQVDRRNAQRRHVETLEEQNEAKYHRGHYGGCSVM